jgi:hypothetical protein
MANSDTDETIALLSELIQNKCIEFLENGVKILTI